MEGCIINRQRLLDENRDPHLKKLMSNVLYTIIVNYHIDSDPGLICILLVRDPAIAAITNSKLSYRVRKPEGLLGNGGKCCQTDWTCSSARL